MTNMTKKIINEPRTLAFPATFRKFTGPLVDGGYTLTFDVSEQFVDVCMEVLKLKEKNFILVVEPIEQEEDLVKLSKEDPKDRRNRLMRKVHALLEDVAAMKGLSKDKVKELIKDKLHKEGKLDESLVELSNVQLYEVINRLENAMYRVDESTSNGGE